MSDLCEAHGVLVHEGRCPDCPEPTLEERVAYLERELKWTRDTMLRAVATLSLRIENHKHTFQANGRDYTTNAAGPS